MAFECLPERLSPLSHPVSYHAPNRAYKVIICLFPVGHTVAVSAIIATKPDKSKAASQNTQTFMKGSMHCLPLTGPAWLLDCPRPCISGAGNGIGIHILSWQAISLKSKPGDTAHMCRESTIKSFPLQHYPVPYDCANKRRDCTNKINTCLLLFQWLVSYTYSKRYKAETLWRFLQNYNAYNPFRMQNV